MCMNVCNGMNERCLWTSNEKVKRYLAKCLTRKIRALSFVFLGEKEIFRRKAEEHFLAGTLIYRFSFGFD